MQYRAVIPLGDTCAVCKSSRVWAFNAARSMGFVKKGTSIRRSGRQAWLRRYFLKDMVHHSIPPKKRQERQRRYSDCGSCRQENMQVDQKERVGLCKNGEKVEEYKEIDKFYTKKRIHSLDIFQRVV